MGTVAKLGERLPKVVGAGAATYDLPLCRVIGAMPNIEATSSTCFELLAIGIEGSQQARCECFACSRQDSRKS
jgi:hypothetical protein